MVARTQVSSWAQGCPLIIFAFCKSNFGLFFIVEKYQKYCPPLFVPADKGSAAHTLRSGQFPLVPTIRNMIAKLSLSFELNWRMSKLFFQFPPLSLL